MAHISEYEVEDIFIGRLESIGYKFIKLDNYDDVLANFREQLAKFNAKKLTEKGHDASFSDAEFNRIMIHVDNHSVYESAKILRDKYVLQLDNGESVYIDFFSSDTDRNIYQVTHQVTMDKAHKDDVVYKNRYDVTVLVNGLPLVQIELKRPGVEINEAINQINRYRKFSFKGIFRYLQLFVVSNSVQTKYFCNENEMMDGQYNPILKSLVFFWTDEKNTRINDLNTFTGEFFRKSAITEIMDKYMVIKTTEPVLMVMRPYQIYAVKAAKKRVSYNAFPKFVAPKCDDDLLEDPAVRDELLARRGYAKEIRNRYASAVPDYGEDNVRAAGQAGTHSVQQPVIESGRTREQSDKNVEH